MGLGPTDEKKAHPALTKLPTSTTSKASIAPNRFPISEEAQAVLSDAALPDFSYMLATFPVAPAQGLTPLTVDSSTEQQSEPEK